MKKRIISFVSLFFILMSTFVPLTAFADSVDLNDLEFYSYEQLENTRLAVHSGDRFFEFQFFQPTGSDLSLNTFGISMSESSYQSVSVSSSGSVTTLQLSYDAEFMFIYKSFSCSGLDLDNMTASSCNFIDWVSDDGTRSRSSFPHFARIVIDADDMSIRMFKIDGTEYLSGCILHDFNTNFDGLNLGRVSLSVSFEPALNGSVSRSKTVNGKEYTSSTLDLHVSNHGCKAQFAWFIVPSGSSVSFPDSLLENNAGFVGSPTYAYVTDEWLGFQIQGFQGNNVYAPTAWHTIPEGYTNQIYHVPWNHMKLAKNTQYDVVVYACVNALSGNDKTVNFDLYRVSEVYRSTFSITDPAEYSTTGDAFGDHPWDPDEDHTNLFNTSAAFKDDNGNIVIKGQTKEGGGLVLTDKGFVSYSDFNSSSDSSSFRRSFDNFLGFINFAFRRFPGDVQSVFYFGFIGCVVLAIVKKVF